MTLPKASRTRNGDDRIRQRANHYFQGSLAVLAEGNRAGLVEDMPALVQDILGSGYWIDPEVVETFLGNEKEGGAP